MAKQEMGRCGRGRYSGEEFASRDNPGKAEAKDIH